MPSISTSSSCLASCLLLEGMTSAAQWVSRGASLGLYPPPSDAGRYSTKPLPPLPPQRKSIVSAFSAEVRDALMTPETTPNADDGPFAFDWEESPGRSVRLSQAPGPKEIALMRQRQMSMPALVTTTRISIPLSSVSQRGPRSAGLERSIARATAGPDARPDLSQRHTLPAAATNSRSHIPTVPSDEILSPHPKTSVQKILKLTGNMSPNTALSTDTPSLHNSTQKIRQLTSLDFGSRRGSEAKLQTLDEEELATPSPSEAPTSMYNYSSLEHRSYTQPESLYSTSYVDSVHTLNTPLSAPRYAANTSPPTRPLYSHNSSYLYEDGFPSPVTAALRLSGFIAADVGVATPGEMTPVATRRHSWYQHHNGQEEQEEEEDAASETHSSSSSEISDSEFELEPTAAELYHDTAVDIAKSSPRFAPSSSTGGVGYHNGSSSKLQSKFGWDNNSNNKFPTPGDTTILPPSRGSTHGSIGASTIDSAHSSSSRNFSLNPFRKPKDNNNNTLSERRGQQTPSALDASSGTGSGGTTSSPSFFARGSSKQQPASAASAASQRNSPYPPVSSNIRATVEEVAAAEDGQARFSLLARIFTSGSGSGSAPSSIRDSTASNGSSVVTSSSFQQHRRTTSVASTSTTTAAGAAAAAAAAAATAMLSTTDVVAPTGSSWSPDTPSPGATGTFGEAGGRVGSGSGSAGLLARTMDHARNAAGRKGKESERLEREKAERARESLRGRIKVMREEEDGGIGG